MKKGQGYAEIRGGVRNFIPFADGQIGFKPADRVSLFGFGQWQPGNFTAGGGGRIDF